MFKKCQYCGKRFSDKSKYGNRKYCSEKCSKNARREKDADRKFNKRHSIKYVIPLEYLNKEGKPLREFSLNKELGSMGTSQTSHRNKNFKKEAELISKEKKRLGLK